MNVEAILKYCVIVEIVKCEDEVLWYSGLVGEQLVAFGYENIDGWVYVCHADNRDNEVGAIPLENLKFVRGGLGQLWGVGF